MKQVMKQVWFTKDGYGEMCAHLEKPARDADGRLHSRLEFPVPTDMLHGECCRVIILGDAEFDKMPVAAPAVAPATPARGTAAPVHPWKRGAAANAAKAKAKAVKAEAARGSGSADREKVCPHCGKQYLARRKDQTNCLAPACRRAAAKAYGKSHDLEKALRAAHKAPVAPKAAPVAAPAPVSRVDRIKAAAARLDGIPDGVRAAAAEARESEAI